ncbi:ribosomal protein L7/L12 [uncultured Phycicoccus sp.]|uniref:ribosomal protein L7/L12 n=1 Tax=uncultured Phycicoccus sp. TaxID=661422 RepID=UPI002605E5EB|nr:ribosomal protein L7/L12 [uncultured Phycicoccus sp.]
MWLVRLLLIVAVIVAVWYVVRAVRAGGMPTLGSHVRFVPVEELPEAHRQAIEVQLAQDQTISAIKLYREATGAGLKEAKTAVETYRWKHGGDSR